MRRLVMTCKRKDGCWSMDWEPNWMYQELTAPMTEEEMRALLRSESGVGVAVMCLDPDEVLDSIWPKVWEDDRWAGSSGSDSTLHLVTEDPGP